MFTWNRNGKKAPLLACLEEIDIFYRLLEQYPDDLMQVRTAADIQTLLTSGKRGMMLTVEEGGACLDSWVRCGICTALACG